MADEIGAGETLSMWTVYEDPTDYPGEFVARRFVIGSGFSNPTTDLLRLERDLNDFPWPSHVPQEKRDRLTREAKLRGIRAAIRQQMPGATCLARNLEDDPKIVETWL